MKTGLTAMLSFLLIFANSAYGVISLLPPPAVTPSPVPSAPALVSINPAANTGQGSQNGGAGANNAIGAALMALGAAMMAKPPTMPLGAALMAMGALALAQGAEDGNDAGQSGQTAATSATTGGGTIDSATTPPTPAADTGVIAAFQTPAGQQALQALTAAGGSVSADGVTMPDGSTKPWSAFSSGAALTANGFDGATAMKTVAALERKFGVDGAGTSGAGMAVADAPGGAAKGGAADIHMPKFINPFAMDANGKAKLAAGKTLNTAGGDPIGVKMDSLFGMIHRAYERQRAASSFIDNRSGKTADDDSVTASLLNTPEERAGKLGNALIKRLPASSDSGGH